MDRKFDILDLFLAVYLNLLDISIEDSSKYKYMGSAYAKMYEAEKETMISIADLVRHLASLSKEQMELEVEQLKTEDPDTYEFICVLLDPTIKDKIKDLDKPALE